MFLGEYFKEMISKTQDIQEAISNKDINKSSKKPMV